MKRRDFVLRSVWVALLFGVAPGRRAIGQQTPATGDTGSTFGDQGSAEGGAEGSGEQGSSQDGEEGSESDQGSSGDQGSGGRPACGGTTEYLICLTCETPAYQFEVKDGKILQVVCGTCGNDDPNQFACPEELEEAS